MNPPLCIYWVRRDFRIRDNPALAAAAAYAQKYNAPLLPLFVLEDYMVRGAEDAQFGYPSRKFLSRALPAFAKQFPTFALVHGVVPDIFAELSHTYTLTVFVNEDIYTDFYSQVEKIRARGTTVEVCPDQLTISRDTLSGTGTLYSVFTPFKKKVWHEFMSAAEAPEVPLSTVTFAGKDLVARMPHSIDPTESVLWEIISKNRRFTAGGTTYDIDALLGDNSSPFPELAEWYHTEEAAHERFTAFLSENLSSYADKRNYLSEDGTSKMSLALTWGLISTRTLKSLIQEHYDHDFYDLNDFGLPEGPASYLSELIWREFYKYLLYHRPELLDTEFQERFRGTIEWVSDTEGAARFTAWMRGETGYPLVDAAMKQLAATGWMHNRARMVVASILTKNLGVDWRWGQEYFRAMLIDLDEASNNGGWQWGASVGADPKPIRIFNPYLQAKNYDADGAYQRRWLGNEPLLSGRVPLIPHADARAQALIRYHQ